MNSVPKDVGALRIVFMGTPDFAVPSLVHLAEVHHIIAVYCQPPRRQGRGMRLTPHAVHQQAEALGIAVKTPLQFDADAMAELAALNADLLVVVAYGLILPEAVLGVARYGAINGHASLLPRWRGAAPIARAIEAGDDATGVSIMQMAPTLDTGDVILQKRLAIGAADTGGDLYARLGDLTAAALLEAIAEIDAGTATRTPQNDADATYARKITDAECALDFTLPSRVLRNKIRAFAPRPGAWVLMAQAGKEAPMRLAILEAEEAEGAGEAGAFLGVGAHGAPMIATGDGALALLRVKPAGKGVMSGRDFVNGYAPLLRVVRSDA